MVGWFITAPLLEEKSTGRVPGEYVVVFEETVSDDQGQIVSLTFTFLMTMTLHVHCTLSTIMISKGMFNSPILQLRVLAKWIMIFIAHMTRRIVVSAKSVL